MYNVEIFLFFFFKVKIFQNKDLELIQTSKDKVGGLQFTVVLQIL